MSPWCTSKDSRRSLVSRLPAPVLCAAVLACSIACGMASAASAAPQAPLASEGDRVEFLLRDGRWIGGRLDGADESGWSVSTMDRDGSLSRRSIDRGDAIACLVGTDRRSLAFLTPFSASALVFTDGQYLPGTLEVDARPVRWQHRWIGAIPIRTEALSEIRLLASRRAPARADADTVLFLNGDVATGFIDAIGDEVVFEPSQPGSGSPQTGEAPRQESPKGEAAEPTSARRLQIGRIAAIAFASLEQPSPSDALLWTADGTIVRARDVAYKPESGWRFMLADSDLLDGREAKPIGATLAKPTAILFDRDGMTPLAACTHPKQKPHDASYRYERTAQVRMEKPEESLLGLGSIEFDGPTHASFDVPAPDRQAGGLVSFSAELALVEPVPIDSRTAVTVRFIGTPGETILLDATNRRAQVRISGEIAGASSLEIIVDDGGDGIAGDRIAIHRGCFTRPR